MMRRSKRKSWESFADRHGGRLQPGGLFREPRVEFDVDGFDATLERYVVMAGNAPIPYTKMRLRFAAQSPFEFSLEKRHFFHRLGEWFGLRSLQVGATAFRERYRVQSNRAELARALVEDSDLRRCLDEQRGTKLQIRFKRCWPAKPLPKGIEEITLTVSGEIRDLRRLEGLGELLRATLRRLIAIGVADAAAPKVVA